MAQLKTFVCDICKTTETEKEYGGGVWNWIQISGVALNGVENPVFCPVCRISIMNHVDALADQHKENKT